VYNAPHKPYGRALRTVAHLIIVPINNLDLSYAPLAAALVARLDKRHVGGRLIARIVNTNRANGTNTQAVFAYKARRFKFL
jgi:hypothetical protein